MPVRQADHEIIVGTGADFVESTCKQRSD